MCQSGTAVCCSGIISLCIYPGKEPYWDKVLSCLCEQWLRTIEGNNFGQTCNMPYFCFIDFYASNMAPRDIILLKGINWMIYAIYVQEKYVYFYALISHLLNLLVFISKVTMFVLLTWPILEVVIVWLVNNFNWLKLQFCGFITPSLLAWAWFGTFWASFYNF